MKSFDLIDREKKGDYLKLLSAISKLSGLFSESSTPYINYRVAENIFCKSFDAENLSRSDTAFDAKYNSIGIGLKTFTCPSNYSTEKIAEFNSLSQSLSGYKNKKLACKLAEYRNARIDLAKRTYNIETAYYHIVARKDNELILFETEYDKIDVNKIHSVKNSKASLQFQDEKNFYSFNYSKSTLFKRFYIPSNAFHYPVEIIKNPYDLLLKLFEDDSLKPATDRLKRGVNYVILPLYGWKNGNKFVFKKSGLNQWNAKGRERNAGEVYIRIPKEIHNLFPEFFPKKDKSFKLKIPTGEKFSAKVCQDNSKALMTNPNKDLSNWLLRKVFQVEEKEFVTIDIMDKLGFDSVIVYKDRDGNFSIDIAKLNSYEDFIKSVK